MHRRTRTRSEHPFFAIRIRFVFVAGGSQHKKKTPKNHDKPLRYHRDAAGTIIFCVVCGKLAGVAALVTASQM
jgi:hypothetical protein